MPKPRLTFREFLLVITLASLITASFAIRARTTHQQSLVEQDFRLHQARNAVTACEEQIEQVARGLEVFPPVAQDWVHKYDLRLIPRRVKGLADIPKTNKNMIVLVDGYHGLEFRMFDGDGKMVVNIGEHENIEAFKEELEGLWPPHELTGDEKRRIIGVVRWIIGNHRVRMQSHLQTLQALHAKALAEAEEQERMAGRR
jgi:hypothetical protein